MKETFTFDSSAGTTKIFAVRYVPDGEVKAVLQIAHGMVEFIERYENFAAYLNARGILVTGNDHIGHGASVNSKEEWGYFAKENGNQVLYTDMHKLTEITKKRYPNVPYFLLGHSMGSFYTRQYLCEYGKELDAAIVMGTGYQPLMLVRAGRLITKIIALFKGWKYRSKFVDNMAFGGYNKKFEPSRTSKDWLTKDTAIVDQYLADPRCTFMFTLNGYYNMFTGISRLYDKKLLDKMPKELPVLFVAGADDPVGDFGEGVKRAAESFQAVGMKHVEVKLYPNDRHEILNETDREQVYEDLYVWLSDNM